MVEQRQHHLFRHSTEGRGKASVLSADLSPDVVKPATMLRKPHKKNLPILSTTPVLPPWLSTPSTTPALCSPLASGRTISRARPRKLKTAAASTRRLPSPTPFEEPAVPLLSPRDAWKAMGRRFQNAHKAPQYDRLELPNRSAMSRDLVRTMSLGRLARRHGGRGGR